MLNFMLVVEGLPTSTQECLFEVFRNGEDWSSMARLAHLGDLCDSIDNKIAKLPAVAVRSAWVTRPGRSTEQICSMVRSEKRVTVRVEMASMDLGSDEPYQELVGDSSPKVLLALLGNKAAPLAVRRQATRKLAENFRALTHMQRNSARQMWNADHETCEPLLEVAQDSMMLHDGLRSPTATAAGRANVLRYIKGELKRAEEYQSTWGNHMRSSMNGVVLDLVQAVMDRPWCTAKLFNQLVAVVDKVDSSGSFNPSTMAETRLVIANHSEGTDPMAEMVERAGAVDDEAALALLAEVQSLPGRRAGAVRVALMQNSDLSLPTYLSVLRRMDWSERPAVERKTLSVDAMAALVVEGMAYTPDLDVVDTLLEHMADLNDADRRQAVRGCMSNELEDRQLMALPAKDVASALADSGAIDRDRLAERLGRLIAEGLEGQPATLYAQFAQMARNYSGGTAQLLAVCKATQA